LGRRLWLRALVSWPRLLDMVADLPVWQEGDNGRPPDFPPVVLLIVGICARKWGGFEEAEAEFRDDEMWQIVLDAHAADYPEFENFRPGHYPTYHHYRRWRRKFGISGGLVDDLREGFERSSAAQALDMGMLDEHGSGSTTHMDRSRMANGDGVVLQSLYGTSPDDVFLDPDTGEKWQPRSDPDARRYPYKSSKRPAKTDEDDRDVILGTMWVTTHANTGRELERVTLTVDYFPQGAPGGEAAIAVEAIKRIKRRAPGMQGVCWDKALRGVHIDALLAERIQPVVKVALEDDAPRERGIGQYVVKRNGVRIGEIDLWAVGGKACMHRRLRGEDHFVPLIKKQIKFRDNGTQPPAVYQVAELPHDPLVPLRLRGGRVRFRHDNHGPEQNPDLNRAEVLRTVAEADDDWDDLYHDRPGSESDNERDQHHLPRRRAPSRGASNQQVDLICLELGHNLDAELAYIQRTAVDESGQPPPHPLPQAA
jgi:hypothetical protein